MDAQDDMQRTLRGVKAIYDNIGDDQTVNSLTRDQMAWKLKVIRQQLDNILFNMRQRYPEE